MEEHKLLAPSFNDGECDVELRDYSNGDYRIVKTVEGIEVTVWQGSSKFNAIARFQQLQDPHGDEGRQIELCKARIVYKDSKGKTITKEYRRLKYAVDFRRRLLDENIPHEFYSIKEGFRDIKF